MVQVLWLDTDDSHDTLYNAIILTKTDNETMILRIGDFITYNGRPDGVRIEEFTGGFDNSKGPIGMTYLPWRKEEQQWATPKWNLKGNIRHIIAYPCGIERYGEHIDWNTVRHSLRHIVDITVPETPHLDASEAQQ